MGAVTLEAGGSLPGGGAEGGQASCSEKPAAAIDEEVGRLVEEARATARRVLEEQRPVLELLAQRLIDQETIEADEIEGIVHRPRPRNWRRWWRPDERSAAVPGPEASGGQQRHRFRRGGTDAGDERHSRLVPASGG